MLSHEEMVRLQSEKHDLIDSHRHRTKEEFVLHRIHTFAYLQASLLAKNKTVLDLGCNTGYGSEILSHSARAVVGADVSAGAVASAKRQYGHRGIDFRLLDGRRLPFETAQFDMIVSCQVIEHIVDYATYIAELRRVLSPLGIVLLTTPNAVLRLDPGMKPWNPFHVREFDHSELEALLAAFFPAVQVMGLFAEEPFYSIEVARLNRAREKARKRHGAIRGCLHSCKSKIRAVLPRFVVDRLRQLAAIRYGGSCAADRAFIDGCEAGGFCYRSDSLDTALDLLAVCANEQAVLRDICIADTNSPAGRMVFRERITG